MILAPIYLDTPVCTVESFAERTGMDAQTVARRVRAGRIPQMPKEGKAETVLINLVLYTQMCLNQPGVAPVAQPLRKPRGTRKQDLTG